MSSTSIIPLEIEELIIDLLAEDDENYLAIKACSLVGRTFLPLCRKHIFGSIALNLDGASSPATQATTHQFERLLSKSPEIADYIRRLAYNIRDYDLTAPSIQECLKQISKLQYLSLLNTIKVDWTTNNLRPVLLHLLHLPTLTHFRVTGFKNFIASDLAPCVYLKKLDISDRTTGAAENTFSETLPDRSIQLNEFKAGIRNDTAIMGVCKAQCPDGRPVIDFSSLAKLKVIFQKNIDMEVPQEFPEELFKRCKQLADASIFFYDPREFCPSLSKLLRPSMETLTLLNITTSAYGLNVDPLGGIPSELEDMRNNNIIEKIIIKVLVKRFIGCRHGDDWGRLDEVLTRPGWPALRLVLLTIAFSPLHKREPAPAFQKLPETQFPRLSASKSVSFKFEITRTPIQI